MSDLRERVVTHYVLNKGAYADIVDAAIAIIRAETLEEAAKVADKNLAWSVGYARAALED